MNGKFHLASLYPGFRYFYRPIKKTKNSEWVECKHGQPITDENERFEFVTSDNERMSRIVK